MSLPPGRHARQTNQIVGNIQQIGANATALMKSVEIQNEEQHDAYNAQQESNRGSKIGMCSEN